MEKSSKVFVGMDVHKESIDITLAELGGEVRRLGQIGSAVASRCLITAKKPQGKTLGLRWCLAAVTPLLRSVASKRLP